MMSRIPPVSPASIMFVVRSSNTTGYWRMALANVAPPSTVVRTPVNVFWNAGFSWLAARISRHCTSGRPASIMTENWRKKMAMSFTLTLPEPNVGMTNSLPFSRMAPGVMRSRRNWVAKVCLLAATRSPLIFSPVSFFPENVKTGMLTSLGYVYVLCPVHCFALPDFLLANCFSFASNLSFFCLSLAGRSRFRHARRRLIAVQQGGAAVDHFRQFVLVAGAAHGHFHGDLFLEIGRGQRLVESLHSELVLTRLHGGINLVDLVFPDQVADRGIRNQDLHAHGAALAVGFRQQGLTHDAFEHQRQLRPNLGLLVGREYVNDSVNGGGRRVGVQRAEG